MLGRAKRRRTCLSDRRCYAGFPRSSPSITLSVRRQVPWFSPSPPSAYARSPWYCRHDQHEFNTSWIVPTTLVEFYQARSINSARRPRDLGQLALNLFLPPTHPTWTSRPRLLSRYGRQPLAVASTPSTLRGATNTWQRANQPDTAPSIVVRAPKRAKGGVGRVGD